MARRLGGFAQVQENVLSSFAYVRTPPCYKIKVRETNLPPHKKHRKHHLPGHVGPAVDMPSWYPRLHPWQQTDGIWEAAFLSDPPTPFTLVNAKGRSWKALFYFPLPKINKLIQKRLLPSQAVASFNLASFACVWNTLSEQITKAGRGLGAEQKPECKHIR